MFQHWHCLLLCQVGIESVIGLVGRKNSCKVWQEMMLDNLLVTSVSMVVTCFVLVGLLPFERLCHYGNRVIVGHQLRGSYWWLPNRNNIVIHD